MIIIKDDAGRKTGYKDMNGMEVVIGDVLKNTSDRTGKVVSSKEFGDVLITEYGILGLSELNFSIINIVIPYTELDF